MPEANGKRRHVVDDTRAELLAALAGHDRLRRLVEEQLGIVEQWRGDRAQWHDERRLLHAVIDQVPDYLFAKDTECRFVVANKAVANDVGHDPDSILGKTDLELHPPRLAREFYENDKRVIRTGKPVLDHEEYVILPSGQKRWLSTSKVPLRNDSGVIIGMVGIARDITQRKQAEEQIRQLAYSDQLTGLGNRTSLEQRLTALARRRDPGFLLLLDLDRFKQVNDTLGHNAGDSLLQQVGQRLTEVVGRRGFVSRIGGDEFGILLDPGVDAAPICGRIMQRLGATFFVAEKPVHVGVSIGVARIDAAKPMESLREADIALYEAKGGGRNRWRLFESEMALLIESKHRLEEELRSALRTQNQIQSVFQPVFRADGSRMTGAEALARWRHPTLGLLGPASFIPVAEESGLIRELGDRILDQACALLARSSLPWVAVNVSTVQLHAEGFAEKTLAAIAQAGVDPARLQLEITESVLLDESDEVKATLAVLRGAGLRVALDDFGTGYSSLGYLRRFPIDKIKVDRSFVSEIGSVESDAIVEAIIALARGLDMAVTAEGVETEAQRQFLARLGCDEVQGYLTGRPVPDHEILRLAGR